MHTEKLWVCAQTDTLRKFYASLRRQVPDSLMAKKWCASADELTSAGQPAVVLSLSCVLQAAPARAL